MNNTLQEFLEAAKRQGASDESLVALLRGRGWPEDDVHRALADHFENRSGVRVPEYKRSGSAKDAFLYLLSFSVPFAALRNDASAGGTLFINVQYVMRYLAVHDSVDRGLGDSSVSSGKSITRSVFVRPSNRGGPYTMNRGRMTGKPETAPLLQGCLLYTSPSPRDLSTSRMPSSA